MDRLSSTRRHCIFLPLLLDSLRNTGLQRCGKSCRLRWTNYLRPDLKHGEFSDSEEHMIVKLHSVVGNRWTLIAAQLPGRTDNDVKNHWNTKLKKKLSGMGIDPVTHKPFSHLMAEIATALPPPQVAHLAEAALGCFKDEMLHLLTKKRAEFSPASNNIADAGANFQHMTNLMDDNKEDTIQKIKLGLSRAIMNEEPSDGLGAMCDDMFQNLGDGFRFDGEGSAWSTCTGGGGAAAQQQGGMALHEKIGGENGDDQSDCALWDLSDELMNLN